MRFYTVKRFKILFFLIALSCCTSKSNVATVSALHFPFLARREQQKQQQQPINTQNPPKSTDQSSGSSTPSPSSTPPKYHQQNGTPNFNLLPEAASVWFSTLWQKSQAMVKRHLELQRNTYRRIVSILLYKPPVGIVTVYLVGRWLVSGRFLRVYSTNNNQRTVAGRGGTASAGEETIGGEELRIMQQEQGKHRNKRRRAKARAFELDAQDQVYVWYGAVERVRGRLCIAALSNMIVTAQQQQKQQEERDDATASPQESSRKKRFWFYKRHQEQSSASFQEAMYHAPHIYATALNGLELACPPGGSRYDYVDQVREPLAQLQAAAKSKMAAEDDTPNVVQMATQILELRATDALLRECRDRLLQTTFRLARIMVHWDRRVESAKSLAVLQQSFLRETIDGDRLRLAYAKAAYEAELNRLGRVCAALQKQCKHGSTAFAARAPAPASKSQPQPQFKVQNGRPQEMQDVYLVRALAKTSHFNYMNGNVAPTPAPESWSNRGQKKWRNTWKIPLFSRYSLFFERGKLILRHMEKDTYIDGVQATKILMQDDREGLEVWYRDAQEWVKSAKTVLYEILEETVEGSVPASPNLRSSTASDLHKRRKDLQWIREAWNIQLHDESLQSETTMADESSLPVETYNHTKIAWGKALTLVDDISEYLRFGEGRRVKFRDLTLVGRLGAFDVFGIPSLMAKIYVAHLVHRYGAPYWPTFCEMVKETWQALVAIFITRFWEPAKGVLLDILNREKSSMLDGLKNEELSLDNMLKDLQLGDGKPATRGEALEAATRLYEKDLRTGLFRNVASGQLVRLLLVQVQQLKVGLLNAIGDIDVLIQSNKLNVRLLATIPAILMVTFVTRFAARNLYNIRSRDLRPISEVHEEMTRHLHRLKSLLLLANGDVPEKDNVVASSVTVLGPSELGEFALRMHRYLILLDFCSPQPFPKWQCDDIHRSMQDVLGSLENLNVHQGGIDVEKHVALVDLTIEKHESLRQKYL